MRRWQVGALGLAAGALSAPPASPAAPPPDSPEWRTPPVVVSAIRPAELPEDPSSFTTVVEVADFEGEQKSVEDLLGQTVGVQLRRFGGPGAPSEISIRGSTGSQVVILLDGVRLNSAQSGAVDLSTLPASLIERIEISRGGGSIQGGSDAVGGVVNLVTRRTGATPETRLGGGGGSFGTAQASGSQSGRIGALEAALGYDFFRSEGNYEFQAGRTIVDGVPFPDLVGQVRRINNRVENHAGLLKLGRDFGERVHLGFSDQLFYGSAGRPGPAFGPGASAQQSATAHQRRTRNVASLELEASQVLGLDAGLRLFHRFERSRFLDPLPPQGAAVDSDNRNQSYGGRGRVARELALGPSVHSLSLGTELREDRLDARQGPDRVRLSSGLFAQDEIRLLADALRLVPALRFDHTEGFGSEWLPRLGLVVQPLAWLRFKVNGERSYRVPNFDELYFNEGSVRGNPALRPEEAWNVDGGFELAFERLGPFDAVRLELAGFHQEIDNQVVFQLVSANVVAATNTGRARASGLELMGGLRLGWLGFSANYTLLDTEKRSTGQPLPGRARQEYDLRVELSPPNGLFKLVAERAHTSKLPVNFGGSRFIPGRSVYGASLSVDMARIPGVREDWRLGARRIAASVAGTNLTDQAVRDAQGFPQPGRALAFGVEGSW